MQRTDRVSLTVIATSVNEIIPPTTRFPFLVVRNIGNVRTNVQVTDKVLEFRDP